MVFAHISFSLHDATGVRSSGRLLAGYLFKRAHLQLWIIYTRSLWDKQG